MGHILMCGDRQEPQRKTRQTLAVAKSPLHSLTSAEAVGADSQDRSGEPLRHPKTTCIIDFSATLSPDTSLSNRMDE
jgi:hypothetical protein